MSSQPQPDDDLEALFDRIADQRAAADRAPVAAAPLEPANESLAAAPAGEGDGVFQRIGQLTRALHESLRELGYDRKLEQHAVALPDAHARLKYIAKLSGDAAERVLGHVEQGHALCDRVSADALALDGRWTKLMAGELSVDDFKVLAGDTRAFVQAVPGHVGALRGQLGEIMMAQDFHDLSGQVNDKVAEIVRRMEKDLLTLLVEACPQDARPDDGSLAGPPIPGRSGDVVQGQQQVDQLLESLGF